MKSKGLADTTKSARPSGVLHQEHEESLGCPQKGDRFRCEICGMQIEVVTDCKCDDCDEVHFRCCGQELDRL